MKVLLTMAVMAAVSGAAGVLVVANSDPGTLLPAPAPHPHPGYPYPYPPVSGGEWSPGMVILVITSAVTALGGLITAVIAAITKSKVELGNLSSAKNNDAIQAVHKEVMTNTVETVKSAAATDQVKVRVEQLEQKMPVKQSETDLPV